MHNFDNLLPSTGNGILLYQFYVIPFVVNYNPNDIRGSSHIWGMSGILFCGLQFEHTELH